MKSALAMTFRSVARTILASSIASLVLAGLAHGADVDWSGTQTLTLGVDLGGDDVTRLENIIFNANTGAATAMQHGNADSSRHSSV